MQAKLHKYIMQVPFCRRIYEKPLGYVGDFLMLQGLYDNALEGDNLYQKFVHHFTVNRQMAESVRNRTPFIKSRIRDSYRAFMPGDSQRPFTFASIASGAALEVIELLREGAIPASKISLVDIEKLTWQSIVGSLGYQFMDGSDEIDNVLSQGTTLRFINRSVYDFFKGFHLEGEHDFIYSTGLFDYLRDDQAASLLSNLLLHVAPGGELIVGNFDSREESARAYMEFLLEWSLIYRDENALRRLADNIVGQGAISIESDASGIQLYLVIKKS